MKNMLRPMQSYFVSILINFDILKIKPQEERVFSSGVMLFFDDNRTGHIRPGNYIPLCNGVREFESPSLWSAKRNSAVESH